VCLLGYTLTPCEENPTFSTEYFNNLNKGIQPSKQIDDQLFWLSQQLGLAGKQVNSELSQLNLRIRDIQR
jgi:hypothetical protein